MLHAYLVEDDVHHGLARGLLGGLCRWVVPGVVVDELVWGLRRRLGWREAGARVSWLLGDERVEVVPVTVEDAWFALRDARRYEDLLVLSVARRLGLPLATLDRGLARLARRHGVGVVPVGGELRVRDF